MAVGPRITIVTVLADLNLVRSTYTYTCMQERNIGRFFFLIWQLQRQTAKPPWLYGIMRNWLGAFSIL